MCIYRTPGKCFIIAYSIGLELYTRYVPYMAYATPWYRGSEAYNEMVLEISDMSAGDNYYTLPRIGQASRIVEIYITYRLVQADIVSWILS